MRGRKKGAFIVFLIYLIFGLYFLNSALGLIVLPDIGEKIDKWIVLVGAVLIMMGAVNYFRISHSRRRDTY